MIATKKEKKRINLALPSDVYEQLREASFVQCEPATRIIERSLRRELPKLLKRKS